MVGVVRGMRGGGQELSRKGTPRLPVELQGITAAGLTNLQWVSDVW